MESVATGAARATTDLSANGAATFGIHLLGKPRFTLLGEPFRFSAPPRTLPLLAYLLLHRGAHLTRECAALAMWPDDSEEDARANLRRHLHHLKQALPHVDGAWFAADGEAIRWQTNSRFSFDVDEFERCVAAGDLGQAVELYAGDLLPSVYDDWIGADRERLRSLFISALEALLSRARSRRQFTSAIEYARRILGNDPWREDTLRQLISIRYESGDRTGALHEFETFAQRLRSEMNAEPMAETIALRDIALRGGPLPEHPAAADPERREPTARVSVFPFVGRAAELAYLRGAWARAAQRNGSFLLIAGEAGIGKSRLASELALFATSEGGRVLRGSTSSSEQTPYQALREVLRDAVPMFGSLDIRPIWLSAIAVLVPSVASRLNIPAPPPLDPQRERGRLFEALAQTFTSLAQQRPLLVILEDLQWAGASSIEALEFVARQTSAQPVLIVGTYRTEAVVVGDPISALRRRLSNEHLVDHVTLGGLDAKDIGELVTGVPELSGSTDSFTRRILEISGGNPLFVGELLQHADAHSQPDLPPGVSVTILARAEMLSRASRLVADIASVVGDTFDVELVRLVSGYDENMVLDSLGELLDRRMIREAAAGRFEFGFAHHAIQEALYNGVAHKRRIRWHRRIAATLEHLPEPERLNVLGVLARHWDLSGNAAEAAQTYLSAAQRAFTVYAHDETVRLATRGLELVGDNDEIRFELLLARQGSNRFLNIREAQEHDIEELRHTTRFATEGQAQCRVLERAIRLSGDLSDRQAEIESIEMLLRQADSLDDDYWRAIGHERSAVCLWNSGRLAESSAANALAAEFFERIGHDEGRLTTACLASLAAAQAGDFGRAADHIATASEIARSSANPSMAATAARVRALIAVFQGNFAAARAAASELLEVGRSIGDRKLEVVAHGLLGTIAGISWQIQDARLHLELARGLGEAQTNKHALAEALVSSAQLATQLGHLDDADLFASRAVTLSEALGADAVRGIGLINLASIALSRGEPVSCIRLCEEALKLTRSRDTPIAVAAMARAKVQLGEFNAAIKLFEEAIPKLRHDGEVGEAYGAMLELASAYLATARLDDAEGCVERLMREMETSVESFPKYYRPRIFWTAGRALQAAGGPERADDMFARARAEFEELREAIPDAETRECFSALPQYREIVAYMPP